MDALRSHSGISASPLGDLSGRELNKARVRAGITVRERGRLRGKPLDSSPGDETSGAVGSLCGSVSSTET